MLVRLALEEDMADVLSMARQDIEETRSDMQWDEHVASETYYRYIETANPTIFVVEDKRKIVGFLLASISSYRAASGFYTVQEVLYVKPGKRGSRAAVYLMKHFIEWSIELGAREIIGGNDNSFQSDRTAAFLAHFGFEKTGYAMRRLIDGRRR